MSEQHILALTGKTYCGKSTVAELVRTLDPRFHKASFGLVLKEEFCKRTTIDLNKTMTPRVKEMYRQALIEYSKTVKKEKGEDYFARALFESIKDKEYVVIDDLRFIEELDLCIKSQGAIFKVWAEPHQRASRGYSPGPSDWDLSETELDFMSGYDWWKITKGRGGVLYNTRDTAYISTQVCNVLKTYFPPIAGSKYKEMVQGVA